MHTYRESKSLCADEKDMQGKNKQIEARDSAALFQIISQAPKNTSTYS